MRRRFVVILSGAAAVCCASLAVTGVADAGTAPGAARVVKAGGWSGAIEVPGAGALNTAGAVDLTSVDLGSVSCARPGDCAAGGYYIDRSGNAEAFVASERRGVWGRVMEVPGSAALNAGGNAQISSVSCAPGGNCAAGGFYTDGAGHGQAFVAGERRGVWGRVMEVPGSAALNTGGFAEINSVSCAASGNCSAGGTFTGKSGSGEAFVVTERHGIWGRTIEVPGLAALNRGGDADVLSVSCASAGSCAAGGRYTDASRTQRAYVVSERRGVWGSAAEVPGSAGFAWVSAVSCTSGMDCVAGGSNAPGIERQSFVVSERRGVWGRALQVAGLGALNKGGDAELNSVSCAPGGNCAAGGFYLDASGQRQAFVVDEQHGVWGRAIEVPGLAAENEDGFAAVDSVSCMPAGNCAAGGYYSDSSGNGQAFVASERHGVWGRAIEVPGSAALNKGGGAFAVVESVSCVPAGSCAAAGSYSDGTGNNQAFVASERHGRWGVAIELR